MLTAPDGGAAPARTNERAPRISRVSVTGVIEGKGKTGVDPNGSPVDKVKKVYEAVRTDAGGKPVKRELAKAVDYDSVKLPAEFKPVKE
jgi:hypothetical protein